MAAEERGYGETELRGTIQNDPLKEYIARNTYVFPPRASLFLAGEVIRHCTFHMPKFHPISVSGYHFKEMGANPVQEVSFMIANGLEYIDECTRLGFSVDEVAPKFSFFSRSWDQRPRRSCEIACGAVRLGNVTHETVSDGGLGQPEDENALPNLRRRTDRRYDIGQYRTRNITGTRGKPASRRYIESRNSITARVKMARSD